MELGTVSTESLSSPKVQRQSGCPGDADKRQSPASLGPSGLYEEAASLVYDAHPLIKRKHL